MDYIWNGVHTPSVERLSFTAGDRLAARSVVVDGEQRYAYEATLDRDWVFRDLSVRTHDRRLDIAHDGLWRVDGQPRPDLAEAVDIDLAFSPFTNTLPIRRLGLAIGSAAEIVTAYVEVPSLRVSPDPQRYTRIGDRRYLYESLDSDFSREVTVDGEGFVLDYPGLYTRAPVEPS